MFVVGVSIIALTVISRTLTISQIDVKIDVQPRGLTILDRGSKVSPWLSFYFSLGFFRNIIQLADGLTDCSNSNRAGKVG